MVAERDTSIRCAVAVSPPVDWFRAMWDDNWPPEAVLDQALHGRIPRTQTPGQFIEWFVEPFSGGQDALVQSRRRILASSAAYFADRLPATLAFNLVLDRFIQGLTGVSDQ